MCDKDSSEVLCSHCSLPTGILQVDRALDGEKYTFCCYGCCLAYQIHLGKSDEPQAALLLIRLGVGGFLSMNIMLFSLLLYSEVFNPLDMKLVQAVHWLLWALTTPVLLILGAPFIRNAWTSILRGKTTSDTLIALGACAAYGYSVVSVLTGGQEIYFDTVTMILVLFTLGRYLEAAGRAHCARSLEPMLNDSTGWANVLVDGQTQRLPVAELVAGMTLWIAAGERIVTDGIVLEGQSHVDESMLTGESSPVEKTPGMEVLAGTLNTQGRLLIEASVTGASTRWAGICRSVREALARKSPIQRIADRVAARFVPAVLLLAGFTVWYHAGNGEFSDALLAGVAVLVVACPCALGLATPLATSLGISNAAQSGCMIRGGEVFEKLAGVKAVAFDKTGTLTTGETRVVTIICDGTDEEDLLKHAATLEQGCRHPTALGILAAAKLRNLSLHETSNLQERTGLGVQGNIGGINTAVGNLRLMDEMGWSPSAKLTSQLENLQESGHTRVFVGWEGQVFGAIILDEQVAEHAFESVAQVQRLGMATCLLSGDETASVARISKATGIENYKATLSPEEKLIELQLWEKQQGRTAMVGDGLNDGPALSTATVGVAVGSATDLVREIADVILPSGGLGLLPWIFLLSQEVKRVILSNLFWAFGYNVIALGLAAAGLLQPIFAAGLMAGSSLIVVMNSLRLKTFPGPTIGEHSQ